MAVDKHILQKMTGNALVHIFLMTVAVACLFPIFCAS